MSQDPLAGHARNRSLIEARLHRLLAADRAVPQRLRDAMGHSLFSGGKRLRPLLLLGAFEAWAGRCGAARRDSALDAGCAFEMMHTYSLIHDDLPAMDDDVLRRGRPTCHVAFDEATAILAGDGLQALAFTVISGCGPRAAELVSLLAAAAGPGGMVGGQLLDLDSEGVEPDAALVRRIHRNKTAVMIAAPLTAGALLGGADGETLSAVQAAGLKLGMAFQATDDVLDVMSTAAELGKTPGKDAVAGKVTRVSLEGLTKARSRARRYGREGVNRLERIVPDGSSAAALLQIARILWDRSR